MKVSRWRRGRMDQKDRHIFFLRNLHLMSSFITASLYVDKVNKFRNVTEV